MEFENCEVQDTEVAKKSKYIVHIEYSKEILKTFAKFYNGVKHPRATAYMFFVGITLFALPFVNHDIKLPGLIVCYVMGPVLFLLSLFRHNISVLMMKDSDEMKIGDDLVYRFGNTGVQVDRGNHTEFMGNYKKIYRIWEDEKTFFIGMNEDDLIVLPKDRFEEGDVTTFRDFIIEKSRCIFTWRPRRLDNMIKWKWVQFRTKKNQEAFEEAEKEKGKK